MLMYQAKSEGQSPAMNFIRRLRFRAVVSLALHAFIALSGRFRDLASILDTRMRGYDSGAR